MNTKEIPLPSREYMQLVCGWDKLDLAEHFEGVGTKLVVGLHGRGMLGPDVRFLDVGCGCGRLARHLVNEPLASYTGFDRHTGMVEWCKENIGARAPSFTFLHFELKSAYVIKDGEEGNIDAASFRFPFDDGSFDAIVLASVFTHMPLNEIGQYLREFSRVLAKGGKVFASFYMTTGEPYVEDINFFYTRNQVRQVVKDAGLRIGKLQALRQDVKRLVVGKKKLHNWFLLKK